MCVRVYNIYSQYVFSIYFITADLRFVSNDAYELCETWPPLSPQHYSVTDEGWAFIIVQLFIWFSFSCNPHLRICFSLILEGGRERETLMREKHRSVASCICPDWVSNPPPFSLWEDTPTNRDTLARAVWFFRKEFKYWFFFSSSLWLNTSLGYWKLKVDTKWYWVYGTVICHSSYCMKRKKVTQVYHLALHREGI